MLRIFKKYRMQLISESKFGKYFLYALGEIALVSIGVLLAIQANNANQDSKAEELRERIYLRIISDIESNSFEANGLVVNYSEMEYLYKKVLHDSVSEDLLNEGLDNLTTGFLLYEYDKTGVEQLRQLGDQDSLAIEIIRIYDNAEIRINASMAIVESGVRDNLTHWRDAAEWFPEYVNYKLSDAAKDYFVNSQDYRNKVSYMYLCVYQSYIPSIQSFVFELERWKEKAKIKV